MNGWKKDNRTGPMKLEAKVAKQLGFTHNVDQRGGLTADFTCPEGFLYEFKNLSRKPYIELASSWDYKKSWKTTGIPTQATVCDFFVFLIPGEQLLKVPSAGLMSLVEQGGWEEWCTWPNANGNRDGHFSRGVFIPYTTMASLPGAAVIGSFTSNECFGPRAMPSKESPNA